MIKKLIFTNKKRPGDITGIGHDEEFLESMSQEERTQYIADLINLGQLCIENTKDIELLRVLLYTSTYLIDEEDALIIGGENEEIVYQTFASFLVGTMTEDYLETDFSATEALQDVLDGYFATDIFETSGKDLTEDMLSTYLDDDLLFVNYDSEKIDEVAFEEIIRIFSRLVCEYAPA